MEDQIQFGEVGVTTDAATHVAIVEMQRPPDNAVDIELIRNLADAVDHLEADMQSRAIVLCSAGKHFCAGARLGGEDPIKAAAGLPQNPLYAQALRLFRGSLPIVAAVQGAAVGAGLGLALASDIRVTCSEARFAANFARLGTHPGFGISATLPRLVGEAAALDMLYTGRRVTGDEAVAMSLCQRLVPLGEVRSVAIEIATDIAVSAPLSLRAIRRTMRAELAHVVEQATIHEHEVQVALRGTEDYEEGVRAYGERRPPNFTGR